MGVCSKLTVRFGREGRARGCRESAGERSGRSHLPIGVAQGKGDGGNL